MRKEKGFGNGKNKEGIAVKVLVIADIHGNFDAELSHIDCVNICSQFRKFYFLTLRIVEGSPRVRE